MASSVRNHNVSFTKTKKKEQIDELLFKMATSTTEEKSHDDFLFDSVPSSAEVAITADCQASSVSQRLQVPSTHRPTAASLLPVPMVLRTKRTVRCRRDLEEGRMNILLQPKSFPLEGDSSLKIQRGKWWLKDCSAVLELPLQIHLLRLPDAAPLLRGKVSHLQLRLTNPRESEAQLLLLPVRNEDEGGDEGEVWADRERQSAGSLRLSAAPLPTEGLRLAMAAFEDELLRDADEEDSHEPQEALAGDGNEQWVLRQRQNTALLTIPVKLTQLPGPSAGSELLLCELRLQVRLDSLPSSSSSSSSSALAIKSLILPIRLLFQLRIPPSED